MPCKLLTEVEPISWITFQQTTKQVF